MTNRALLMDAGKKSDSIGMDLMVSSSCMVKWGDAHGGCPLRLVSPSWVTLPLRNNCLESVNRLVSYRIVYYA